MVKTQYTTKYIILYFFLHAFLVSKISDSVIINVFSLQLQPASTFRVSIQIYNYLREIR